MLAGWLGFAHVDVVVVVIAAGTEEVDVVGALPYGVEKGH